TVVEDTICDEGTSTITVSSITGLTAGEVLYDYSIEDTSGPVADISGYTTDVGISLGSFNQTLDNHTDQVQWVEYRIHPYAANTGSGVDCDYGTTRDTVFRIWVNPTPRIDVTVVEDTICDEGASTITVSSITSLTAGEVLYDYSIEDTSGPVAEISGYTTDVGVSLGFFNQTLDNHTDQVQWVEYRIHPYAVNTGSGTNCDYGTTRDTVFRILVNPTPTLSATFWTPRTDSAVCFNDGYQILITSNTGLTTGLLRYALDIDDYWPDVQNVQMPDTLSIANLDEGDVINIGESIVEVTYRITPVIVDALGSGRHCPGNQVNRTMIVTPELKSNLVAEEYFGGWEIRCNGLLSDSLHSNVEGGYYKLPYRFSWEADSAGTPENLTADSVQIGLGVGNYSFIVWDTIGCVDTSGIVEIREPDAIELEDTIVSALCWTQSSLGSIDVTVSGGTTAYNYEWFYGGNPQYWNSNHFDSWAGMYGFRVLDANLCQKDTTYTIGYVNTINPNIDTSDYEGYAVACFGDTTTGYLDVFIVEGIPPYEVELYRYGAHDYNNDDPVATVSAVSENDPFVLDNLAAGGYVLYAFDDVGCINPPLNGHTYQPIILSEPDPVTVSRRDEETDRYHDTVDISCYNADDGAIHLQVSGGRTANRPIDYYWEGADPDLNPTDSVQSSLGPGLYKVTVADVVGCSDSIEFDLIEPSEIMLQVDSMYYTTDSLWNITCAGESDGYIGISSDGGILGHHYSWSSEQMTFADGTLPEQGGLVAGTYQLTITDSIGCTRDDTFNLEQPDPLGMDSIIPKDITGTYAIACADSSSGAITLIPYGGADSTRNIYLWSSGNGSGLEPASMNQAGLTAGTYTVDVTDINGCSESWDFVLDDPPAIVIDTLEADSARCANTATGFVNLHVSGGVPGYGYQWSNGAFTQDLAWIGAGVYTVVVKDTNQCVKIDSIEVFEADQFDVVLAITSDYNGTPISCAGSSDAAISLSPQGGTEPYSYLWSSENGSGFEPASRDQEGLTAGTYHANIVDYYGCADSAEVVITEPDPIDYTIDTIDPLCYGDSNGRIDLLITGGTVYALEDYEVWLNGSLTGPYNENLPEGDYFIRIEDLNDCYAETQAELRHPDSLALEFATVAAYCKDKPDGELSLYIDGGEPPYYVRWDRDPSVQGLYLDDLLWGEYVATVTDFYGCVTIDTAMVDYTFTSCLEIPNAFSPNGDGFNDRWVIEGLELYPNVTLKIFDRWGNLMYVTTNAVDEPWDGYLNGRILPIDSYHYIMNLNNDEPPITGNITIVR
ncbi:MAG: gliding motility-associated C-terminal domain-containing protein, partial [Bacteroidota bacterium]